MALTVARCTCWRCCCSATRVAAFFAALLLALTPQQILWSATAAVEPSPSLACVVALLAAVLVPADAPDVPHSLAGRGDAPPMRSSSGRSRC